MYSVELRVCHGCVCIGYRATAASSYMCSNVCVCTCHSTRSSPSNSENSQRLRVYLGNRDLARIENRVPVLYREALALAKELVKEGILKYLFGMNDLELARIWKELACHFLFGMVTVDSYSVSVDGYTHWKRKINAVYLWNTRPAKTMTLFPMETMTQFPMETMRECKAALDLLKSNHTIVPFLDSNLQVENRYR